MFGHDFLEGCLAKALSKGGDYADIFIERTPQSWLSRDDGKVKTALSSLVTGFGIRVITGRNYLYLYASDPSEERIAELAASVAEAVAAGAASPKPAAVQALPPAPSRDSRHAARIPPAEVGRDRKLELLLRADEAARAASADIVQAGATLIESAQEVWIATSEGRLVHDLRVRSAFYANAVARRGEERERGFAHVGMARGFEIFEEHSPAALGKEAARLALVKLGAEPAPTGRLPVVIDNEFGGVIFHEACGHALEATSVADDASVFCGKLGGRIANELVSAVDDGSLLHEQGSAAFDDDGLPTRRNLLIDKGILSSYLVDRLGQAKMGLPANGCGRKESYKFAPTSRMSNTYILPGPHKLEDLISSMDRGLYCKTMGGGSVHPPTTEFNFGVEEAYLVEHGRITRPVKGAALIGKGDEILMNIDMVADELGVLGHGAGTCGSSSGGVPNIVGQPAIRVGGLVVGGRS